MTHRDRDPRDLDTPALEAFIKRGRAAQKAIDEAMVTVKAALVAEVGPELAAKMVKEAAALVRVGATIHHLHHGVTDCRMPGLPVEWPDRHLWSANWPDVNCETCLAVRPTVAETELR